VASCATIGQLLKTEQVRQKEKGGAEARGWEQPLRRVLQCCMQAPTSADVPDYASRRNVGVETRCRIHMRVLRAALL
jgi:hypothetical protein